MEIDYANMKTFYASPNSRMHGPYAVPIHGSHYLPATRGKGDYQDLNRLRYSEPANQETATSNIDQQPQNGSAAQRSAVQSYSDPADLVRSS